MLSAQRVKFKISMQTNISNFHPLVIVVRGREKQLEGILNNIRVNPFSAEIVFIRQNHTSVDQM